MKNFADQGGCYPPRPKAEMDNTLSAEFFISYESQFNNFFIIHSKYFPFLKEFAISLFVFLLTKNNKTSSPGFVGQRFNNLQRAALLTSF